MTRPDLSGVTGNRWEPIFRIYPIRARRQDNGYTENRLRSVTGYLLIGRLA